MTIARSRRTREEQYKHNITRYWNEHCPRRYIMLGININEKLPPEIFLLSSYTAGELVAARSGTGTLLNITVASNTLKLQ